MSKTTRITASGLVKKGFGKIKALVINSHSSGTLALIDGLQGASVAATSTLTYGGVGTIVIGKHGASTLTSSGASVAATHASGTLTVTGAVNFKDAVKATAVLTSDSTNVTAGSVVTLNSINYTFSAAPVAANQVKIGTTAIASMFNLYDAMKYGKGPTGTTPQTNVDVSLDSTGLILTATAKIGGTAANAYTKAEDDAHLDWDGAGATMSGGLAAETATIGTNVYTFKDILSTNPNVANQVKIAATSALTLVNLKRAINATSGYAGVSYSTGTVKHTQVVAYTSNATTCVIKGISPGSTYDTVATTETCADSAWGEATLTDGVTAGGATVTIGAVTYTQVDVFSETYGATAVPNQFLRGASEATMLDALKAAINGTSVGTLCSTGTTAHPYVIATTNADTTQIIVTRTVGNAAHTVVLNALATTETMANTAWTGADIANGTQAAVTTDAALLTIGTRAYSVVQELSQTSGATAVVDQILWVTSEAVFLDNVKKVINLTGTAGTEYSTGTTINTQVTAGANADTTQVITARLLGTGGNAIATGCTCDNYTWTSTVMASGAGLEGEVMFNTMTFSAVATTGERQIDLGNVSFERGLSAVVGGTADISLIID